MPDKLKTKWFCNKVQELKGLMYGLAIGILKNQEDAEDAVQNTLLLAYEHMDDLSMLEKFKPWIMRILTNECYRILNKRRYYTDIDETYDLEDEKQSFEDQVTLWDVVEDLQVEYRTVILLYYYEGMSVRQIARTLNISEANVKQRMSRARSKLRAFLMR